MEKVCQGEYVRSTACPRPRTITPPMIHMLQREIAIACYLEDVEFAGAGRAVGVTCCAESSPRCLES